jgi:hypothetical protein
MPEVWQGLDTLGESSRLGMAGRRLLPRLHGMGHVGIIFGFGRRRGARRANGFFPLLLAVGLSLVASSAIAGFVFGSLKRLA